MAWRWCIGSTSKRETSPTAADSYAATPTSATRKRTGLWCRSLGHWPRPIPARTSLRASSHAFRLKVSVAAFNLTSYFHVCELIYDFCSTSLAGFTFLWIEFSAEPGQVLPFIVFFFFFFNCAESSTSQYCWVCFLWVCFWEASLDHGFELLGLSNDWTIISRYRV